MSDLASVPPQETIISLVEFFRVVKGFDLEVLTSATLSKLEEIKEKTAIGELPKTPDNCIMIPVDEPSRSQVHQSETKCGFSHLLHLWVEK